MTGTQERSQTVRGQEGEILLTRGHRSGPRRQIDRGLLEHGRAVLLPQLLHERPGSTRIRLELQRGRFAVT